MEQHTFDDAELEPSLRGQDAEPQHGHDRLAALAQHIVEASGGNPEHGHGALSMEQTLDQQEQQQAVAAVDLLSFANESGPAFSENYNLEGLLSDQQQQQQQAQQAQRQALGAAGGEDENRDFGGVTNGGYNMDESLSGAYNYHQEVGAHSQHQGSDLGADKAMADDDAQGDGGMGRKRKRKAIVGEDAVKHKKEVHVSAAAVRQRPVADVRSLACIERSRAPSPRHDQRGHRRDRRAPPVGRQAKGRDPESGRAVHPGPAGRGAHKDRGGGGCRAAVRGRDQGAAGGRSVR